MPIDPKRRVAVIGSGFGGLSAAIRLQSQGFDVTVVEKRALAGGRAYVYHDKGFTFDAGPTVVTAPDCLRELWELSGRDMKDDVELIPVSPLYRLHWENGYHFDYTSDFTSTLRQIECKSPGDVDGYRKFYDYTREVFEAGYEDLAHVPFLNFGSMIKVAPQLLKLKAYESVYDRVSHYIKDPELRQAFSFHSLLVGGNPFTASAIYTLVHYLERKWGVFFPRGGTHALVRAMVKLLEDLGGKIRYQSEVDEIITEHGSVRGLRLKNGETLPFDAVVSNADVNQTYQELLRREPRLAPKRFQLRHSRYSMSLFLVYFGTKKKYPNMAQHNVIFGRGYRELLNDIFETGRLSDDFSLYLHVPSRTDPSLAPPDGEAFYALSPVPHLGISDVDWEVEGPMYAGRILQYLNQRYIPRLLDNLVVQRIFTPKDFETELNATMGSAFSLEPLLRQSAYFRTHNRDARIRGLYFVGAGTHPGAGIPGVVNSAKATAGLVAEDFAQEKITVSTLQPVVDVVRHCQNMIEKGSKSFSLAAKLFRPETREGALLLYGWCRFCDDQIDQAQDASEQMDRLVSLQEETRAAFAGEARLSPEFTAMSMLAKRYQIPSYYAEELLEGMAMDARREKYENSRDLLRYCYRVAGTVGLMMSHVMGVSDEVALNHANHMGMAMQLTNIARDIDEDFRMGRIYLPQQWLADEGIPPEKLLDPRYRPQLVRVVKRLLAMADRHYQSGQEGLKYLPFRASIAVAGASLVYRQIGKLVERRGARAWDNRSVVSTPRKIWCLMKGVALAVQSLPYRLRSPWSPKPLTLVWRFAE